MFLDEINFTKRSLVQREWSGKNSNLTVDQEDVYVGFRSVIAAMTEEEGIKHVRIQSEAVAAPHFIEYLKQLRRKMGQTPIALFCDQLAVHRSKDVKPWYSELNIKLVLNVGYSPEFNPIEAVFSKIKRVFNHKRLNCLVNKIGFNMDTSIMEAFRSVTV